MQAKQLPTKTLDTQGLFCPEPVMLLHKAVRELNDGDVVELIASDPSTQRDVPKFCQFLGHELVSQTCEGQLFKYFIRKKAR